MPKINLGPDTITQIGTSTVALDNPLLRNMLVQNPAAAQHWLATKISPVDPAAISIDDQGRVIVADPAFASKIASRLPGGMNPVAGDTACSNGSCGAATDTGIRSSFDPASG